MQYNSGYALCNAASILSPCVTQAYAGSVVCKASGLTGFPVSRSIPVEWQPARAYYGAAGNHMDAGSAQQWQCL